MERLLAPAATRRRSIARTTANPPFDLVLAVALASLLVIIVFLALLNHQTDVGAENPVARCDRLAQMASNRANTSATFSRNAQWRRARNQAFEICMQNPPAFERIVAAW